MFRTDLTGRAKPAVSAIGVLNSDTPPPPAASIPNLAEPPPAQPPPTPTSVSGEEGQKERRDGTGRFGKKRGTNDDNLE